MTDRYNSTASGQAPVNELENTAAITACWSPPSGGAVREIPGEVLTHPTITGTWANLACSPNTTA